MYSFYRSKVIQHPKPTCQEKLLSLTGLLTKKNRAWRGPLPLNNIIFYKSREGLEFWSKLSTMLWFMPRNMHLSHSLDHNWLGNSPNHKQAIWMHPIWNACIGWIWPLLSSSNSKVNARHRTYMMSSALFPCPLYISIIRLFTNSREINVLFADSLVCACFDETDVPSVPGRSA